MAIGLANLEPYGDPDDDVLHGYLLEVWPWQADNIRDGDIEKFRVLHRRVRAVMGAADAAETVALLNGLLGDYPVCPEISGHPHGDEDPGWHLHLSRPDVGVVEHAGAVCAMGLTSALLDSGMDRRGICAHTTCEDVFIDGSPAGNRRYCSDTCQNRANVAAYRARKRAEQASDG